jgi:phosphopantetheinyl transferase
MIPRNLITWRWLVSAISLLDMMHGLRCAAPPRTCFASLSCLAPCFGRISSRLSCVRPPAHCATPLQQHTRALQSLSCTLPTSFPNGLLASPHTKTGSDAPVCVLDDNHVHVWMVQTDCIEGKGETFLESLRDTLSEDEMKRYKRSLVTPKAREQALSFLVARSLLRCTLSRYCPEIAPKCWRFEVNAYGRPALCSKLQRELSEDKSNAALQDTLQRLSKLRFNLSHCSGMVVCAFAYGRDVGIDSEDVKSKRRITSIARRFFTASENAALLSVPEQVKIYRDTEILTGGGLPQLQRTFCM